MFNNYYGSSYEKKILLEERKGKPFGKDKDKLYGKLDEYIIKNLKPSTNENIEEIEKAKKRREKRRQKIEVTRDDY